MSKYRPKHKGQRKSKIKLKVQALRRDGFRCVYCGKNYHDGAKVHAELLVPSDTRHKSSNSYVACCEDCKPIAQLSTSAR